MSQGGSRLVVVGDAFLVVFLLAIIVTSRAAAESAVTTEYEVRYGPLTVITLRATTELTADRYRSSAEIGTVGIAKVLFPWHSSATTEGRRDAIGLHPFVHRSSGEYRNQRRSVTIDYVADGGVVAAVEPPPDADYRDAIPVALQQQTIDPLSATLNALTSQCRGTVRVFDGRRRYDISLTDLGDDEVARARRMIYGGRARRCRGDVRPLGGFWRAEPSHDERPTSVDYWIASPRPDLPPVPVYLEITSTRGTLSIPLTFLAPARAQERLPPHSE